MNPILVTRMRRLERHTLFSNPFAHLSDEDLEARLEEVTASIEHRVGMPSSEYATELQAALDAGETLPDGWTGREVQGFIASLRNVATMRSAHVQ